MRLGLSVVLVAALASGLAACSSDDTGGGGSGGTGSGGGSTTGEGGGTTTGTGSGGDDTSTTTGSGGGGDGLCEIENVADPATECDVDCDVSVEGATGVHQCTVSCSEAAPCDAGFACVVFEDGTGACMIDCEVDACPGTSEYVCDQDLLVCVPDGLSG